MDYVFAVRRVLRALRPAVVVIAETEIWPNLFREVQAHRRGARDWSTAASPTGLFRATAAGGGFSGGVLPAVDRILAQTRRRCGERFVALGAPAEQVRVARQFQIRFRSARGGRPDSPGERPAGPRCGRRKVWIAASTMPPAGPEGAPATWTKTTS